MPTVRVRGLDNPVEVEPGQDLMTALRRRNVNVLWGPWAQLLQCRGIGLCGLCDVRILDGADQVTPRTKREEKRLRRRPEDWRLACQVRFKSADAAVEIEPFPVLRPEEKARSEAVRRAHLTVEERIRLADADRQAELERLREAVAAHQPQKKRRRLPFGRKRDGGGETPGGAAKPDKPRRGIKALRKPDRAKREGAPAAPTTDVPADEAAQEPARPGKRRFALKGKP